MPFTIHPLVETQIPQSLPSEQQETIRRCIHRYSQSIFIPSALFYRIGQWCTAHCDWHRSVQILHKQNEWLDYYPTVLHITPEPSTERLARWIAENRTYPRG